MATRKTTTARKSTTTTRRRARPMNGPKRTTRRRSTTRKKKFGDTLTMVLLAGAGAAGAYLAVKKLNVKMDPKLKNGLLAVGGALGAASFPKAAPLFMGAGAVGVVGLAADVLKMPELPQAVNGVRKVTPEEMRQLDAYLNGTQAIPDVVNGMVSERQVMNGADFSMGL